MFILKAEKNKLSIRAAERLTSDSVNAYRVQFEFGGEWDTLARTAVFRAGDTVRSLLLESGHSSVQCVIPWEVLAVYGPRLYIGVYGVREGAVVLPTIWANCGKIYEGAVPGPDAQEPSPGMYEQLLDALLHIDGGKDFRVLGYYESLELMESIVRTPEPGDAYGIGSEPPYHVYIYDGVNGAWVDNGPLLGGTGDMTQAVYDPQRRKTDIFHYVDEKLKDVPAPENLLTIPGGGEVEPPEGLGEGPYTIVLDETGGLAKAEEVSYDSGESGLEAGNVQTALDQLSAVKADAWRVSGRNLLDNWYFLDPVNQRGQTEYGGDSTIYSFDRWKVLTATTAKLSESGITLTTNSGVGWFSQNIENEAYFLEKPLTFSVLSAAHVLYSGTVTYRGEQIDIKTEFGQLRLQKDGNTLGAYIRFASAHSDTFVAAKLELGSVQTLAHQDADGSWVLNDPPPDKATELLKCQRYYWACPYQVTLAGNTNSAGTALVLSLPAPARLRVTPAFSYNKSLTGVRLYNGETQISSSNISSITVGEIGSDYISLFVNASGLTKRSTEMLLLYEAVFDANL